MRKALVIVESPAKVKSVGKYLGKDYVVLSSVGHVRDLAKPSTVGKSQPRVKKTAEEKKQQAHSRLIQRMGVDPENNWVAQYEILPGKEKVVKKLREAAAKSDTIYLATDLDREGEAIAWHLREAIGGAASRYRRVVFTEITKTAITKAFASPGDLNMDRVHAQQARRFLDRIVGFMLSPLLWEKIARGLSAGRVQSVAVRMLAEREAAIHAFKSEEYWELRAILAASKGSLTLQVHKYQKQGFRPKTEADVKEHMQTLEQGQFVLQKIDTKPTQTKAAAPFITSTLQQAASTYLGYSVKRTMVLAQHLYEQGLITYMRTDSTVLSQEAVAACRQYIESEFGGPYLPKSSLVYGSKKSAQEAHEAIRPTEVSSLPALVASSGVEKDAARIYELIWRQFVACQMNPARYESTQVHVVCGDYELKVSGRVLLFDGFLKVQPLKSKNDETQLPSLQSGEALRLEKLVPSQHFTKPLPRFSEAGLVRELEKKAIGRPSTYSTIISTIQERGYVELKNRRFFALKMGDIVTQRLYESFPELMDYGFTASLEEGLDQIALGDLSWRKVLDEFYAGFKQQLDLAREEMRPHLATEIDLICDKCGRPLNIRIARTGIFLSCTGYQLPPKERCKNTLNLVLGEQAESLSTDEEGDEREIQAKRRCKICDTAMDSYLIDESRKLHVCGRNPECPGHEVETGKFRIKGYEGPVITCDKCGNDMQLKSGRFGKYFACVTAPECKNTRRLLKSGEPAPPRAEPVHMPELPCEKSDGYFILRDGAAGIFLASSKFPKSRETKKPAVEDLFRHKDELDQKYLHLASAPLTDPDGNPSIIRFSKKTKEHYVMSERDGKATGWALKYQNGVWE